MTMRAALLLLLVSLLGGCVSSGAVNPMKTSKGRDEARAAYVQLGIAYLQQGNTERAKIPLKKALDLDSSDPDANAALALVFEKEGDLPAADQYYRKALSADGKSSRILNNYGSFLYSQKRYPEAAERFNQAVADNLYPERSRVYENLGLTALAMNQKPQAEEYFTKSLRLNASQPTALLEMADLSYANKQYVPARQYYDRFSVLGQQTARSLLMGIRLAKIFDDRDKAASLGLQLKRLYPATPEYQQYLLEQ